MQSNQVAVSSRRNKLAELGAMAASRKGRLMQVGVTLLALTASPAFAQISKVNTVMANVQTVLVGVAVTVVTVAIMWAGFKMIFQHAKWTEISNIVIGSIFIGGAAGIAAWLIN